MRVLVTGANGYIGGRLVPRLLEAGHEVRVLVRKKSRIEGFEWANAVDVHEGDVTKPETLHNCCKDMDAAYYLIHSMAHDKDFRRTDRLAAEAFANEAAQVPHVIYLGGLQPQSVASDHLASRAEVGAALASRCHLTEFRAGPVIGSGSASFEMTRYLTERLPVMLTPKWVTNEVTPIGVGDVLRYLVGALDVPPQGIVDIGGEDLPFKEMMLGYARVRGLRRYIFRVPVLAPTLAARWVQFITPITNKLAVPLLAGIAHPVTADTAKAAKLFPHIIPIGYEAAVKLAIEREALDTVETRWSSAHADAPQYELTDWQNLKQEVRSIHIPRPATIVHAHLCRLGGENGWPAWNWAWRIRGAVDRMVGGPGLRRGRRSKSSLRQGDALDFWRVEAIEPPRLLRLKAEMKTPGKAWLQYECVDEDGGTRLIQTAFFEPTGFAGLAYWNSLYPVHRIIFRAMVRNIGRDLLE